MAIKFRCPGCGADDVADSGMAGKAVTCSSCGKTIRLPSGAANPSGTIQFRCPGCDKSLAAPAHLAGKKITCKSCGQQGIKIPGESASAAIGGSTARAGTAKRPASVTESGQSPLDIFGLDEASPAAKPRAGADELFADSPSTRAPAASPSEEALPPRNKAFEPMSEAKKKRINKRADKINKEKPSFAGAGIGVSFGTIVAITLFGWRLYRIGNKVNRAMNADAPAAAPFDGAGVGPAVNFDPRAIAADADRDVERMLKEPGAAEAREWLDAAKHPDHGVFEMDSQRARAMVAGFYERGARRVAILEPSPLGNKVITSMLAVELPAEPEKRAQCIAWEAQYLDGEEPSKDVGQKYLPIMTD